MSKKQTLSAKLSYARQRLPLGRFWPKKSASPASSRSRAASMNSRTFRPVFAPRRSSSKSSQWVTPCFQSFCSVFSPTPLAAMNEFWSFIESRISGKALSRGGFGGGVRLGDRTTQPLSFRVPNRGHGESRNRRGGQRAEPDESPQCPEASLSRARNGPLRHELLRVGGRRVVLRGP